ncbi:hypothetical protein G6F68_012931 [Rhizopus microsporus]|nr:hypothetical protein G6F68_012931 [Rhizopus microsporus]
MLGDGPCGCVDDARSRRGGGDDAIHRVRAHACAHSHGRGFAFFHQRPHLFRRQVAVDQAIVLQKVLQAGGHAMPRQVVRRGAQHPADGSQAPGHEAGTGLLAHQHGQVYPLLQQIDGAVDQMQVQRHVGMQHQELCEQGLQVDPAVQGGRGDTQAARGLGGLDLHAAFQFVHLGQQAFGFGVVALTRLGQPQDSGRADKQPRAQAFLQRADAPADRRQRDPAHARGTAETALVNGCHQ